MVAMFMWTMGPKTKGEDKVFCKTRDVGWNLGNMKMKSNKRLLCYSIRYQTGSLIWVLKDMFQFFRFLPKSDYASLWCLLPVVDEDCENVKTMSGFRTCPHFPLNPIIVNFNLCFFYLLSFLCLVKEHVLIFCWIPSLLAPSGALIAIPTYYWPSTSTTTTHFFRSHRSSTLDFHFLSH